MGLKKICKLVWKYLEADKGQVNIFEKNRLRDQLLAEIQKFDEGKDFKLQKQ